MTAEELSNLHINKGDMLYVYLKSNVLKVGTYQGIKSLPHDNAVKRLCVGLEPQGKIYEWLDIDYIKTIEIISTSATIKELQK